VAAQPRSSRPLSLHPNRLSHPDDRIRTHRRTGEGAAAEEEMGLLPTQHGEIRDEDQGTTERWSVVVWQCGRDPGARARVGPPPQLLPRRRARRSRARCPPRRCQPTRCAHSTPSITSLPSAARAIHAGHAPRLLRAAGRFGSECPAPLPCLSILTAVGTGAARRRQIIHVLDLYQPGSGGAVTKACRSIPRANWPGGLALIRWRGRLGSMVRQGGSGATAVGKARVVAAGELAQGWCLPSHLNVGFLFLKKSHAALT
jgi:hypothetical protein